MATFYVSEWFDFFRGRINDSTMSGWKKGRKLAAGRVIPSLRCAKIDNIFIPITVKQCVKSKIVLIFKMSFA